MLSLLKNVVKAAIVRRVAENHRIRRSHLPREYDGLPPSLWDCGINTAGHLTVQGLDVVDLVEQYGSPLHVVDTRRLRGDHDAFLGAFRKHHAKVNLGTSYKTNPVPAVLSVLHNQGTYAEVISHFELWLALKLGVPPERVILNGPGKGTAGISLAVNSRVKLINIDSPFEVPLIATEATHVGHVQDVGVRVVTSVGWSSQFGLSLSDGSAFEAFEQIRREDALRPRALHLHLGTGIKNVATYMRAVHEVLEFAKELERRLGIIIDCYDLGGGFGVPTVRSFDQWDSRLEAMGQSTRSAIPDDCPRPSDYAEEIYRLFREYEAISDVRETELIFEPGRAITSSSQILLLRVLAVKNMKNGAPVVIADGGKNIAMPLGWESHQIFAANKMKQNEESCFDIFGPLCHPGDVICRRKRLPSIAPGDVLAIMDAGAYFIPNQMNFSNPRPPVILIDGGVARLGRERESFEDIVRLDRACRSHHIE